jgi:Fe-S cluster assembly protein SufD
LRDLHADADLGSDTVTVTAQAPDAVTVERVEAGDPRLGGSGFVPADRVSVRVWHEATRRHVVTVPRETEIAAPVFVDVTGGSVEGAAIDLWFPTAREAAAWGRRAVTITLH